MPVFKVIYRVDPHYSCRGLSKYHDDETFDSVISYCTDPKKAVFVGGFGVNTNQAAYEMNRVAQAFGHEDGLRLRHWVLAFQPQEFGRWKNIDPVLQSIAWHAARYYAGQYQILYAIHRDTENPHIHFVMSTVSFVTGRKYGGDKADYYAYQHYLAELLQAYGMHVITVPDDGKKNDF